MMQNLSGWLVFRLKYEPLELSDMKQKCCSLNCDVGVMQLIRSHAVNKETVSERWKSQLVLVGFPQPCKASAGIVPHIRQQLLPFKDTLGPVLRLLMQASRFLQLYW
jgi:hypothetical protein